MAGFYHGLNLFNKVDLPTHSLTHSLIYSLTHSYFHRWLFFFLLGWPFIHAVQAVDIAIWYEGFALVFWWNIFDWMSRCLACAHSLTLSLSLAHLLTHSLTYSLIEGGLGSNSTRLLEIQSRHRDRVLSKHMQSVQLENIIDGIKVASLTSPSILYFLRYSLTH